MNKKFKVRVKHFAEGKYVVQYANYYIFPIWKSLMFWFDQGHPGGTQCWSTNLYNIKEAEETASRLKSMNDVEAYYIPEKLKCKQWHLDEKEYTLEAIPYHIKEF